MNKASGGDGIPVELFQILKNDAVKVLHSICHQIWTTHDITYKARLVDTNAYKINDAISLYGFIAGILASNNDITDVFVDSALKICENDTAAFETMLDKLSAISENVNIVMTASIAVEECPAGIKAYA